MVKKSLHINKVNSIKRLFWTLLIVVAINYISNVLHFRFDLTSEKKYTLTDNTKLLLKNLKDPVFVEVYLEGNNLPTGIKKLRNETKDLLEEFRILSKGKVEYHFFNIDKIKDEKKKEDFQKTLAQKGIFPTNVQVKSEGGFQEKLVFPGALVKVKGKELPIQILEKQIQGAQQTLNNSINFLEYKIANSINKIARGKPPIVAFVTDKGGPSDVSDFLKGLYFQNFQVQRFDISSQVLFRQGIDILVIAKPTQRFSEEDKFKIDQYVMHGGKVMWMIDQNIADLDSFKSAPSIISVQRDLNLTDILFKYGVRLNNDLVLDLYCNPTPVSRIINGQPQMKLYDWVFNPIILSQNNHPIVKNLDPVAIEFASSLDTIRTKNINKTILLQSSQYSRLQATPFEILFRRRQHRAGQRNV
jgi:ABC-2 type transport system permease protein